MSKLANSFKQRVEIATSTKLTAEERGDVVAVGVQGELGEADLKVRKLANGGEHVLCPSKCQCHLNSFACTQRKSPAVHNGESMVHNHIENACGHDWAPSLRR